MSALFLFEMPKPPQPDKERIQLHCEDVRLMLARPECEGADLVFADPPWSYNNNPGGTYNPVGDGIASGYETTGNAAIVDVLNLAYDRAKPGARLALWCTFPKLHEWFTAAVNLKWVYKSGGSWHKHSGSGGVNGLGFHWIGAAEIILMYTKPGARTYVSWEKPLCNAFSSVKEKHSEKPVSFMESMIHQWCPEDGLILDIYSGLGSAARAAKRTNRRYVGAEIDEERHKLALIKLLNV